MARQDPKLKEIDAMLSTRTSRPVGITAWMDRHPKADLLKATISRFMERRRRGSTDWSYGVFVDKVLIPMFDWPFKPKTFDSWVRNQRLGRKRNVRRRTS